MEPLFAEKTIKMTNKIAFEPNLITLEITENVLISDLSKVQPVLQHLRDQGFKLSLVKTIIAIRQFCNLTVVFKGVETKEQYERLVLYRCDSIEG